MEESKMCCEGNVSPAGVEEKVMAVCLSLADRNPASVQSGRLRLMF